MQIKSLNQMEKIVKQNGSLSWDGWTVVASEKTERGKTSPTGALVNGVWYIQKRYSPSRSGWEIPNKFVG